MKWVSYMPKCLFNSKNAQLTENGTEKIRRSKSEKKKISYHSVYSYSE